MTLSHLGMIQRSRLDRASEREMLRSASPATCGWTADTMADHQGGCTHVKLPASYEENLPDDTAATPHTSAKTV